MRNSRLRRLTIQRVSSILACLTLQALHPAMAQECDVLLHHGIFDVQNSTASSIDASSYARWFCDQHFQTQGQAQDFGASFEQPFRKFAASFSSDNWQTDTRNFCESVNDKRYTEQHLSTYIREVSPTLMKAFNDCIGRVGLHVWLEHTADPRTVFFAARYNPDEEKGTATIRTFNPGDNFTCSPSPLDWRAFANRTLRARCTRKDDRSVAIAVDANHDPQGGGKLFLPEIPPPPPPTCPTEAERKCEGPFRTSYSIGPVTRNGCEGISVYAHEHKVPDSVYFVQITANGHPFPKCTGPAPQFFGRTDQCPFEFNGKKWYATLDAVNDLGGSYDAVIRLQRDCRNP